MTAPRWRQAYDAVDKAVTPKAEAFVRTETFAQGAALLQRAQKLARDTVRGATARGWHLLNLPAGSDVSRLRAQIGALDREVRRLTVQLETERRRNTGSTPPPPSPEERDADPADPAPAEPQPAGGARPRAPRRRPQRAAGT